MFTEFREILRGFGRVAGLLHKQEKISLGIAVILMLITGFLTNLPAVILGNFVDQLFEAEITNFDMAIPYLVIIIILILATAILTIIRKYLVENVATQTEKKQTVKVINRLLRTDIGTFINKYQIGSLHGRMFRSIQ